MRHFQLFSSGGGGILTQEVIGSDGNVRGGCGGAYRLVRSRSLNFFPIKDRALSTCCCVPGEKSVTCYTVCSSHLRAPPPPCPPCGFTVLLTHLLCDRSETPVCKAGWRCRSSSRSSASGNSRISLASLLAARQDAGERKRREKRW